MVLLQTSAMIRRTYTMARLVGVDLPREKRVEIALTYIFGVGRTRAKQALAGTGVNPDTRVRDLGDEELVKLRDFLEGNFKIEGDLRREVAADIRRKVEIGSYQGIRCAVSAPRPTRVPARVPSARWPARRRSASSPNMSHSRSTSDTQRSISDPRSSSDHLPAFRFV